MTVKQPDVVRVENSTLYNFKIQDSVCEQCGGNLGMHIWVDMDRTGYVVKCSIQDATGNPRVKVLA